MAPNYTLTLIQFEKEYKNKNIFMFNFESFGYSTLHEVFASLSHLVEIKETSTSTKDCEYYTVTLINVRDVDSGNGGEVCNTLEMETVDNLKEIIMKAGVNGIELSDLFAAYIDFTGKAIEVAQLGYSNLDQLISSKLINFIFVDEKNFSEPKIYYQEQKNIDAHNKSTDLSLTDTDLNKTDRSTSQLTNLKGLIDGLLEQQTDNIELDEFYECFERCHGWKLEYKEYGFKSYDEFITEIVRLGFIEVGLIDDSVNNFMIICPKKTNVYSMPRKTVNSSPEDKKLEFIQTATAKFMQDYVLYNKDIDSMSVLKKLASKKTHKIIVSNVADPSCIQIQLVENTYGLNKLMDDLEEVYCGLGASNFNMPMDYILHGHLCAAIYPGDKNWHRCRITGVFRETQQARVAFIDYGGDSLVPISGLKFLSSQFCYLPVQAVNARFFNIKKTGKKWPRDIINYLLNRVVGKELTAEVIGFNDGFVSLDISNYVSQATNSKTETTKVNLNTRIIQDGFGMGYDEKNDVEFCDFESWGETIDIQTDNTSEIANSEINNGSAIEQNIKEKKLKGKSFENKLDKAYESFKENTNYLRQPHENVSNNNLKQEMNSDLNKTGITLSQYDSNYSNNSVFHKENKSNKEESVNKSMNRSQRQLSSDSEIRIKKLTYVDKEKIAKYFLNLISIDGEIYVHWLEVAPIFGLSNHAFKKLLKSYGVVNHIVEKFGYNYENDILFDLIETKLDIDLKFIGEKNEIWLLRHKQLTRCADMFFTPEYSKYLKNFLRNNKIKRSPNDLASKNEINSDVSESMCSGLEKMSLTNNNSFINQEIKRLELERLFIKDQINNCNDNDKLTLLNQECKRVDEKIFFVKKQMT